MPKFNLFHNTNKRHLNPTVVWRPGGVTKSFTYLFSPFKFNLSFQTRPDIIIMPMIHYVTKKLEVLKITVQTTAKVALSHSTPKTHTQSLNQSALLSNQDNGMADSSFPIDAAVVVAVAVIVIGALALLGFIFRKKIKTWTCRILKLEKPGGDALEMKNITVQNPTTADHNEGDPVASSIDQKSKESQANTSFAPLLEPGDGDV